MPQNETLLTYEGLKKLEEELEYLKTQKRREIAERIKVALGFGDLSENSEYDEAKNEQAQVEERIAKIEERNKRVELDKTWETSWTRKICIMILTYIVVIIYSYLIRNIDNVFLSSLVPVIGFTLSTLSLSIVRKVWEKKAK